MAMVDKSTILLLLLLVRSSHQHQVTCHATCKGNGLLLNLTCSCSSTIGHLVKGARTCTGRDSLQCDTELVRPVCDWYDYDGDFNSWLQDESPCDALHSRCTELEPEIQGKLVQQTHAWRPGKVLYKLYVKKEGRTAWG